MKSIYFSRPAKTMAALLAATTLLYSCKSGNGHFDASGTFEASEVIVSAEVPGKLVTLAVEEGAVLQKDSVVGSVDALSVALQKEQVEASIGALGQKTTDVSEQVRLLQDQLAVQQAQLANLQREKNRVENLLKADAATGKQLDDINSQLDVATRQMNVTRQQMNVQRSNAATQNRGILSETAPLQKRIAQLNDQAKRALVVNPVNGTVITKYAEAGEITAAGKALYKIADLSQMTLRAYITSTRLSQVKLNDTVTVLVDDGPDKYKEYKGTIYWIADKAEFTPKTIQTKEERANLVYALKIRVPNDGYLKIGMYAEVKLSK